MIINHNLAAMSSLRHLFGINRNLNLSLERLSSGLRINGGADDPVGMFMAERMNTQNVGLVVANQNVQDGQALIKIAEGALNQVTRMLTRMEELGVRAINGTLTEVDRTGIMDEVRFLRKQINSLAESTEYNTVKLLNGSLSVKATISGDNVTILTKPSGMRSGDVSFHLTRHASAATLQGAVLQQSVFSTGVSSSGIININGSEVMINSGDTIQAILGRINAVNDQTFVVASLNTTKDSIVLTSGIIDEDAKHLVTANLVAIKNDTRPILGYALMGEQYSIQVSGYGMLTSLGLTARTVTGVNAAGSINGIAMKATGAILEVMDSGSLVYGMRLQTDTIDSGQGTYIRDNSNLSAHVVHPFTGSISLTVKINTEDALQLKIGANYGQTIFSDLDSIATNMLGIGGSSKFLSLEDINLATVQDAKFSIKTIQKAVEDVTRVRAHLGSATDRLEYTARTLAVQRENLTAAQARIQDADIAQEMVGFSRQQILMMSAMAMLSQANARASLVLRLLQ